MEKYIYDDTNGLWYELSEDYYLPCFTLPDDLSEIGMWGQRHLRYIKEHKSALYTGLLLSGKLPNYLKDIDKQSESMFIDLVKSIAHSEGITEELKLADQITWFAAMNIIYSRTEEIVKSQNIII